MPSRKPDRRIERTQESLNAALIALILEKGYDAVTVADIIARANVGRSTFYAHHGSKESLLMSGLHRLREFLQQQQREAAASAGPKHARFAFSGALFEHADSHRDLYHALVAKETSAPVSQRMRALVADLVRRDLETVKPTARNPEVPRGAAVQFATDTLFSVLIWWVDSNAKLTALEADALFRRLALPGLAAGGWA